MEMDIAETPWPFSFSGTVQLQDRINDLSMWSSYSSTCQAYKLSLCHGSLHFMFAFFSFILLLKFELINESWNADNIIFKQERINDLTKLLFQ